MAASATEVGLLGLTLRGAQAYTAFSSVGRTLAKQWGDSPVEGLYRLFQTAHLQGTSPYPNRMESTNQLHLTSPWSQTRTAGGLFSGLYPCPFHTSL
jgi:hypothetical protein